ncbi:winged helix-turn-helix domain-containing protein [Rhodococcus sp. IEGM 1366]|uniref:winged helix-turn-helix domain-containing protein n=1 Tax=Rhodococcus sp. IEGM 1366 TaxID=3082223 RepID=UPI0039894DD3
MSTMDLSREQVAAELDGVAARLRLDNRALLKAVAQAQRVGMVHREIEKHLDVSQSTVHRLLQKAAADPKALDARPADIIDQRAAGQIRTEEMMNRLLNWNYTFGHIPTIDGIATDAYERGSWDDIERAYYRRLLTEDEVSQLMERNKDALERAARGA